MFEKGQYNSLTKYINSGDSNDAEFKINGLIYLSRMDSFLENWDEALDFSDKAIEESRAVENNILELMSLMTKAYGCSRAHYSILVPVLTQIDVILEILRHEIADSSLEKIESDLNFIKGRYFVYSGNRQKGLDLLDASIKTKRSQDTLYELIEGLTFAGFARVEIPENEEMRMNSIKYTKEAVELAEKLENKYLLGHTYNWYGAAIAFNQKVSDSIPVYEKAIETLLEHQQSTEGKIGSVYNNISLAYKAMDDIEQALNYQSKYITLAEKRGDLSNLAFAYSNMSWIYLQQNNFEEAKNYRKKSLNVVYKMNNNFYIASNHSDLGFISFLKGELNIAEREYLLAEKLFLENGNPSNQATIQLRLAAVYVLKMETEKAFQAINNGSKILGDIEDYNLRGWLLMYEGLNYRTLNENSSAINSFEKANECYKKIPNTGSVFEIYTHGLLLFNRILVMLEIKEHAKAKELYEEFEKLTANVSALFLIARRHFLKGIMLKYSTRGSAKFQAQTIFQEIIDQDITDIQIYSLSMLNLCDLLILEMKISENPEEIMEDIVSIVGKMTKLGSTQKMPNLEVMGEFMQGKIDLVNGNLETARTRFEQAKTIAEDYQISSLISKVSLEQDSVNREISSWTSQQNEDLSLQERVEKAQIHEYLIHAISVKEKMVNPPNT